MIKSAKPFFPEEDIDSILEDIGKILKEGNLLFGRYTQRFEKTFAEYIKVKHAIATNTGTSALEIALRSLKIGNGSEVIVPTNTFIGSPNSVIFTGAKPVLADIDPETLCINVEDTKEKISNKTKAVIIVHVAGLITPNIQELLEVCEDHHLFLVEDTAHAHGAMFKDRMAGSLGDVACFSFYPTKIMTTGEGGMICTNISDLDSKSRVLRLDGIGSDGLVQELGHNWHPSEIHSVIGIYQLRRLEEFIRRRQEVASTYIRLLEKIKSVQVFAKPSYIRHSYYKFPVLLNEEISSEKLIKVMLEKHGIEIGRIYYPPCHLQPLYKKIFGFKEGHLPISEEILKRVIALPMHAHISTAEAESAIKAIKESLPETSS